MGRMADAAIILRHRVAATQRHRIATVDTVAPTGASDRTAVPSAVEAHTVQEVLTEAGTAKPNRLRVSVTPLCRAAFFFGWRISAQAHERRRGFNLIPCRVNHTAHYVARA